jgi:hypothetical protein
VKPKVTGMDSVMERQALKMSGTSESAQ